MELGYLEFIKQLINAHEGDSKVLEFFAESKPELKPAIDELLEVINNNKDLLSEAFFYKELFEKSGDALSVIKSPQESAASIMKGPLRILLYCKTF